KDCRNRQRDCANQNAAGEQFCLDGIEQAAQGLCVNGRYPDGSQGPRARYLNYCVGPSTVRDVSTGQVTRIPRTCELLYQDQNNCLQDWLAGMPERQFNGSSSAASTLGSTLGGQLATEGIGVNFNINGNIAFTE